MKHPKRPKTLSLQRLLLLTQVVLARGRLHASLLEHDLQQRILGYRFAGEMTVRLGQLGEFERPRELLVAGREEGYG